MRLSLDGAEDMWKVRKVFLDMLWDDFWIFRAEREKKLLFWAYTGIREKEHRTQQLKEIA